MPSLTGHLWLGAADAEAAATSLAPKLRKSQAEVSRLLAEACSLEVNVKENLGEEPNAVTLRQCCRRDALTAPWPNAPELSTTAQRQLLSALA